MNLYFFGSLVAILIILVAVSQRSRHVKHHKAAREYRVLIDSIQKIETFAEYQFWRKEVDSFYTSYRGVIDARLMLMYDTELERNLERVQKEGFPKHLVTDKLK
jgi:fatty acid desaturase